MDEKNNSEVFVPLNYEILLENLYWTANKFMADPDHKQQNSSREDLIGGYFDRWINRIPEYFIFRELFSKNEFTKYYEPVVDNLIYTNKISKNAPDVIGIKDLNTNKYYQFAKFRNNRWMMVKNAPFIEMKVFRESQKLITIPCSQFKKKHYYAIVESTVPESYLLSVFHDDFFDNDYFLDEYKNIFENFVEGTHDLKFPSKLKKSSFKNDEGFRLLGVYKGSILNKLNIISTMVGDKPDKPKYLKSITRYEFPNSKKINKGVYDNYYTNISSIPIFIEVIGESSKVKIVRINDKCISINVDGKVKINGVEKDSGDYDLIFKEDYRNAVKYYELVDIIDSKELVVEKEITLLSGLLKHFGDEQILISFNFDLESNTDLKIVSDNSTDITFKIKNCVEINGKNFENDIYRFNIVAHNIEKSKDGFKYKMLKMTYKDDNNKQTSLAIEDFKYDGSLKSKYELCANGIKKWKNDEKDFSQISLEVLDSSTVELIKKTQKNFIIAVMGKAKIENYTLSDGFYNIPIKEYSLNSKKHYKFDFDDEIANDEEFVEKYSLKKHPIYLSENGSEDLSNYLKNVNYGGLCINSIFDMSEIKDMKINEPNNIFTYRDNKNSKDSSEINYVPVSIEIPPESKVEIYEKRLSSMIICVKNKVIIDNKSLDGNSGNIVESNFWKLTFGDFERTSKKDELILSKGALLSSKVSSKENLMEDIVEFISKK